MTLATRSVVLHESEVTFWHAHGIPSKGLASIKKSATSGIIGLLEVCESDFSEELAEITEAENTAAAAYEQETKENEIAKVIKEQDVKFKIKEAAGLDKSVLSAPPTGQAWIRAWCCQRVPQGIVGSALRRLSLTHIARPAARPRLQDSRRLRPSSRIERLHPNQVQALHVCAPPLN